MDPEGYIITNAHLVRGVSRVRVKIPIEPTGHSLLSRRSRTALARLVGLDDETDLAVLKVDAGGGLRALPLGDSDEVRAGQLVLAFGSPFGLQNSVSMGIVSSVARQLAPESPMVHIQTDAQINPGNSGGPLVDARGRLVGINTLLLRGSGSGGGPGFAAPSNIVRAVFEQIRKTGRMRRGEIGVRAQTITPLLAAGLRLKRDQGAILGDVIPGGPGARAGLRVGDIVLTLDGKPIENGRQFHVNLYRRALGDRVRVEILRGDRRATVTVSVAERVDPLSEARALADPRKNVVPRLGILAVTLGPQPASGRGIRGRTAVVVATASVSTLDAENGSLEPGDRIDAVNGQWIADLSALRAAVDAVKPGDPVVLQIDRRGQSMFLAFAIE